MKKTLAILLTFVLLATAVLLTSCDNSDTQSKAESTPAGEISTAPESQAESQTPSEAESEPEVSEPEIVYAAQTVDIDRTLTKTLISKECTYTVTNNDPEYGWCDNGTKLTDGEFGGVSGGSNTLFDGWKSGSAETSTVILDLGEKVSGISDIEFAMLQNMSWGIGTPRFLQVFVSDDNETWLPVGEAISVLDATITGNPEVDAEWVRYDFAYSFEKGIEGRYVKFEVGASQFAWNDEVAVYVYSAAE